MGKLSNLIVISDLHCGCRLGLCPPEGVAVDDGGVYMPSAFQLQLWAWWREFWDDWVPRVTHNEPYAVLVNGDAIDGVHHNAVTQVSHNLDDQLGIAYKVLAPMRERCAAYYHNRGTEAHVGASGQYEEMLAKQLWATPNEAGQHARYELWIRIGNALVHAMHHIGTTGTTHYESTAPLKELTEHLSESARWNQEPPQIIIRSHRHRYIETRLPTVKGYSVACVTPGWQGKTPYAWRVAGARQALPQFGGICIRQGDEEAYVRAWYRTIGRSRVECEDARNNG